MVVTTVDDKDQFNGLLSEAGDKLVVVDFSAAWCGPCRTIAPILKEWSEKDYANVMFLKVDVDDNEDIAKDFEVRAMPTFILFRNGKPEGDPVVGADQNALKKAIESNLKK